MPELEPEPDTSPGRLDLGPGDFDIEVPDLATRYNVDQGAWA